MDPTQTLRCVVLVRPDDNRHDGGDTQTLYIEDQLVVYKECIDAESLMNACNESAGEGVNWAIDLRVKNMDPGMWKRWPAHISQTCD